jgi:toxin ParE1/3/4
MPRFTVRPLAWREINKGLDYLEEQAGLEIAEHFLDQFFKGFDTLANMPKIGVLCGFGKPATRRLRRWPVKDFENWLVFYQVRRYGAEIVMCSTEPAILKTFWTGRGECWSPLWFPLYVRSNCPSSLKPIASHTGESHVRHHNFDGNRITLTPEPSNDPATGKKTVRTLTWEKVK